MIRRCIAYLLMAIIMLAAQGATAFGHTQAMDQPAMDMQAAGHMDCADMQMAPDADCPCPDMPDQQGKCCGTHKACGAVVLFVLPTHADQSQITALAQLRFDRPAGRLIGITGQLATPPPRA